MEFPNDVAFYSSTPASFRDSSLDEVEKLISNATSAPELNSSDEDFWQGIRNAFTLHPTTINFNNGGCSPSPRVVCESLKRQIDVANQGPSIFMWRDLDPEIEGVRKRLAAFFCADSEEIAITRNASESLMTCLFGLPMESGDEILTTTLDYPRMIFAIQQREKREGIKMVQVEIPAVPKSHAELINAFERGITSRTKIILVSHVGFMNGQIFPVREICDLGRKHGIPVVVDGAHAFAQFPFQQKDLGCDYFATSLHKWLMAPIGTGLLYVNRKKVADLWALMAPALTQTNDIRKFEEIGTHQAAVHNAIAEALTFHEMIGTERKTARLRYLRSRWTEKLVDVPNIRFHTNLDADHSCAICTVEVVGTKPGELASWLEKNYQIVTAPIEHVQFNGIRVTPQIYTTPAEVDRFADAMIVAGTRGIG